MIDLTNKDFGIWKVLYRAENRILSCGTNRIFWKCKCKKCGNEFEKSSKELRRIKNPPIFCNWCKPKSRLKTREAVHYSKVFCSTRGLYAPNISDNKEDVTCVNCLKLIR